jgi:hypothetical protein
MEAKSYIQQDLPSMDLLGIRVQRLQILISPSISVSVNKHSKKYIPNKLTEKKEQWLHFVT